MYEHIIFIVNLDWLFDHWRPHLHFNFLFCSHFLSHSRKIPIAMASLGPSRSLWRRIAPRLSKDLFTCRQCLRTQGYATKTSRRYHPMPTPQIKIRSTILNQKNRQIFTSSLRQSAATQSVASAEKGAAKTKSSFPKISHKYVAYWLLGSAASVFGIVVFGGLTRLTESG